MLGCLALNGDMAEPLIDNNRWPDVFHDEPCILVIQADARLRSHGLTTNDVIVDGRIKHKFIHSNGINVAFVLAIAVHGALFGVIIGRHELPNRTIVGGFVVVDAYIGLRVLSRVDTEIFPRRATARQSAFISWRELPLEGVVVVAL